MVLLVFSTNRAHALDLYLVFMSRTHFKQTMGELVNSPISTSKSSEPVKPKSKLKIKIGLVEKGDIIIGGVITRILIFRANRRTRSMNFTKRSPVQRTYNTEPSPKELAWGRSTPVYPGKYSSPFCFNFSFFLIVKKMMNEKQNKILSLH